MSFFKVLVLKLLAVVLLSLLLAACGDRRGSGGRGPNPTDSGIASTDAASGVDSGGADAGPVRDGGAVFADAGTTDGGRPTAAPRIISLSASPMIIGPGESTRISAVVGDDDGVETLAGGTVTDVPSGSVLGAFSTPGGLGTFEYTVTWRALDTASSIALPSGGGARRLRATFFDNEGNETSGELDITLRCPTTTDAVCAGECADLATSLEHCGRCDRAVPSGQICRSGVPGCATGLTLCGTSCVDLQSDEPNCGRCGNDCGAYAVSHGLSRTSMQCDAGVCQYRASATSTTTTSCAALCGTWGLTCGSGRFSSDFNCYASGVAPGCAKYTYPGCGYSELVHSCTANTSTWAPSPGYCGYPSSYSRERLTCYCR
jgi:hypothetical protein